MRWADGEPNNYLGHKEDAGVISFHWSPCFWAGSRVVTTAWVLVSVPSLALAAYVCFSGQFTAKRSYAAVAARQVLCQFAGVLGT